MDNLDNQPHPPPNSTTNSTPEGAAQSQKTPQAKSGEVLPPAKAQVGPAEVIAPVALSDRMLKLLGRSVFRDIRSQVEASELTAQLLAEFGSRMGTQIKLVQQLANAFVELSHYQTAREAAVLSKLLQAAREIIWPGFSAFYPPPAGVYATNGSTATAYGEFLENGGQALLNQGEAETIAKAKALLATQGRPDEDLHAQARVLALKEIQPLERMIAQKQASIEALIELLIRLADRLRIPRPPQTAESFHGQ